MPGYGSVGIAASIAGVGFLAGAGSVRPSELFVEGGSRVFTPEKFNAGLFLFGIGAGSAIVATVYAIALSRHRKIPEAQRACWPSCSAPPWWSAARPTEIRF